MVKQTMKAIFILLLLANVGSLYADRGMIQISEHPAKVRESSQKAIIFHNLDEEVLILGTDLVSDQSTKILEFIPFPSEPKVSLAEGKPFESVLKLIKKLGLSFIEYDYARGGGRSMGMSTPTQLPVEMRFHAKIGAHDVSVVKINQIEEFGTWVRKFLKTKGVAQGKNYQEVEAVASDYVKRGIKYFVFDMVDVKPEVHSVKPLVYRFKSEKLYYPLKTSNTFGGTGGIDLIIIAPYTLCNTYYGRGVRNPILSVKLCRKQFSTKNLDAVRMSTSAKISTAEMESIYAPAGKSFPKNEHTFMQLISYYGEYNFDDDILIDVKVKSQNIALFRALREGNIETVKALLAKGADINAKDRYGETALIREIGGWRNIETVKTLLAEGADINAKDASGRTALMHAAEYGKIEKVKILLAKGADVNAKDASGRTALICAASSGSIENIKILLTKGADINAKDEYWGTALIHAARSGSIENVKILLAEGADINAKGAKGDTALMYAVRSGSIEKVKILLAKGADINTKNEYGDTALIDAASSLMNTEIIIKILLAKGADINVKDNSGNTALMHAMRGRRTEIIRLLKQAGAKQ